MTILPCWSLTVYCTHTGFGCVAYEPYGLFCRWLYQFDNQGLGTYLLDHIKANLMQGTPMEWRSILCHGQEWASVCSDIGKEIFNIVHECNETLDIIVVSGSGALPDVCHLVSINMDSILVDCMIKTVDLFSIQVTFSPFEEELMLPQSFEHEAKMLFVLLYRI